ncbi:MAG TPA: BadF/BadG/BcrA/BcrD ATPase family protein [Armatimonadota bacterium]|nr:BadF/BadG/BcrA/BcrD ATPase family protein [Armatimonadota bacterium]
MSEWLVGVDAGGTNTRAAALDPDTGARAGGAAEGANWTVHGPELCRERIERAVAAALPAREAPAALCLCMAGYYPPDHGEAVRRWAAEIWPGARVRVETDVAAAWAGALGGRPGMVVISGTGSIAYGRDEGGREWRAGGWGPLFDDEGSAYRVGLRCLQRLAYGVDRQAEPGPLAAALLARWPELGSDLRGWLRGVYRCAWGREQVAEVAGEVVRLSGTDPDARMLLEEAAERLAGLADTVREVLRLDPARVALVGGLGANSVVLREAFAAAIAHRSPALHLVDARFSPVEGALLLAAEAGGGAAALRRVLGLLA